MTEMPHTLSGSPLDDLPEFDAPPEDPLALFDVWLSRAASIGVREPSALSLATADEHGRVSSRVVLIKRTTSQGVVFGSSSQSCKGVTVASQPRAAATLYWRETLQQVNLAGDVHRLPDDEADAIFADRPRQARAVAWASRQSAVLHDEAQLRQEVAALVDSGHPLLRPDHWAAYALVVDEIEFWSGSPDRLHRRLRYRRAGDRWTPQRLQP